MIRFTILTLFPGSIEPYIQESILARAQKSGLVSISILNIRDFTEDKHRKADDKTYGGGPGMVLKAEPLLRAIESIKNKTPGKRAKVAIMAPNGTQFTNTAARSYSKKYDHVILIAGRYEGIDARVKKILKAEEISIGPYVLSGGELPALVVVESIARQIPGVLGKEESIEENRLGTGIPVYTRPEILMWNGKKYKVPPVLLSGNHKKIENWRNQNKTKK